jgi:hypothetical protein
MVEGRRSTSIEPIDETAVDYNYVWTNLQNKESTITYIEMRVFPDEIPVCGVQYVGLLHP